MTRSVTTLEFLKNAPLFNALEHSHLEAIADSCVLLNFERGDIVFRRGDPITNFYYLVNGCVKIYAMSKDGAEKVIHLATPGESFGEAAMFLDTPAPVGTQAVQQSTVLTVPKTSIYALIQSEPQIAHLMLGGMSIRMHRLIQEIKAMALQSASERVIGYLLQLCSEEENTQNINLPARKITIASLLNLTPETLSRTMSKLERQGLIVVNATKIHIPNLQQLRSATLL